MSQKHTAGIIAAADTVLDCFIDQREPITVKTLADIIADKTGLPEALEALRNIEFEGRKSKPNLRYMHNQADAVLAKLDPSTDTETGSKQRDDGPTASE